MLVQVIIIIEEGTCNRQVKGPFRYANVQIADGIFKSKIISTLFLGNPIFQHHKKQEKWD
jgi:hypothetical protein